MDQDLQESDSILETGELGARRRSSPTLFQESRADGAVPKCHLSLLGELQAVVEGNDQGVHEKLIAVMPKPSKQPYYNATV